MAGNLGYDVQFVIDATHTFDRGGLTADELAQATEANLHEEFARWSGHTRSDPVRFPSRLAGLRERNT